MGGPLFLALDVGVFQPLAEYQRGVRAFLDGMRAVTPAPGFEEVVVPGDHERRCRKEREVAGIPIPRSVRVGLADWARRLGVSLAPEITST